MDTQPHTQEVEDPKVARHAGRNAWVEVIRGPDAGARAALTGRQFSMGADPLADLVLSDPTTSRRHCLIRRMPEGFLLQDLGSTNGTFVDELRLGEIFLDDGAHIKVGNSLLQFRLEPLPRVVEPGRMLNLVGNSAAMNAIVERILKVAPTDLSVIIEGETGTGKELVASAFHEHSRRADGPFIVFDCSAFPPTLIESELFGHERGAFSGAIAVHKGVFERADGGTIFFDELGEMELEFQSKFLRALESGEIRRVGGEKTSFVDVRVIAATNKNLEEMVREGRFRQDLFYRLAKVRFALPPLRDRIDDIPPLVRHFIERCPDNHLGNRPTVTGEGMDVLCAYPWPGNVRELRNMVERAAALADGGRITGEYLRRELGLAARFSAPLSEASARDPHAELLPQGDDDVVPLRDAKERIIADFERRYLVRLLDKHEQNVSRAAREAQVDRRHFYRLLKKYGLMDNK